MATKSKANAADTKTTVTPVDKKTTVAESTTEKKVTTKKAAEANAEIKSEVKAEAKKEPAKKAADKKPAAKKATASTKKATASTKKATTKKVADIEAKTILQYAGKEIVASDILETVKKVWVEKFQGKLDEIKTIELYIKPEENKAYFVVNGLSNGDYFVEL